MADRLHLVRHGEVANPRHLVYAALPGFRLSERGRRQAAAAAGWLSSRPVRSIVSSPLERAVETAEIIASRFDLPVRIEGGLTEWALADRWAGTSWEDLRAVFPGELEAYLDHPADLPFASESLVELAARVAAVVTKVAAETGSGDVVVVSHQDPVQAARLALTGRPLDDLWVDKPVHAAAVSLTPGDPCWREIGSWAPAEQAAVGTPPTLAELDASDGSGPDELEKLPISGKGELG